MATITRPSDCLSIGPGETRGSADRDRADPLATELGALAELGRAASSAALCVIEWQGRDGPVRVRAHNGTASVEAHDDAGLLRLADQLRLQDHQRTIFRLRAGELAAWLHPATPVELELTAEVGSHESGSAAAMLMTSTNRSADEVEATLKLIASAARAFVMSDRDAYSREFWKRRAQTLQGGVVAAARKASEAEKERRQIEDAVEAADRLKPRDLPAGIARLVAKVGSFEAWLVALSDRAGLRIEAASPSFPAREIGMPGDARSALFDSFSRARPVLRLGAAPAGVSYLEDRLFARSGFSSYLCFPFASGVIAVAARAPILRPRRGAPRRSSAGSRPG